MYRTGHYGVALLTYAPVGFALLRLDRPWLALVGGAAVLVLTPLPDYDQRVPLLAHRGATHTVGFALLVGLVLAGGTYLVFEGRPDRTAAAAFALGVGLLAVVAHLLADVVTPAGIRPLWPLSDREFAVPLARADNAVANYLLLGLGVFAVSAVTYLAVLR